MNKFLKFIRDDNVYWKYYDAVYILFHTGIRISEFCGLTLSDIGVTLNTYPHLGLEDAAEEIKRMEALEKSRKEMYGEEKEKPMKQNMFKVV